MLYYILKFDFSGITTADRKKEDWESEFKNKVILGINKCLSTYGLNFSINEFEGDSPNQILSRFLGFIDSLKLEHKIYILIDEYDNFTNGILEGDAKDFIHIVGDTGFVKTFYAVIKEYVGLGVVDRVFITGICPITMDSMTTGFNIAKNITLFPDFDSMIGLTHEEVLNLLNELEERKRKEIYKLMIENYDGYLFSSDTGTRVFNATLVMYFLDYFTRYNKIPRELIDSNIVSNYGKIENIVKLQSNKFYESIIDSTLKTGLVSGKLQNNFNLELDFTKDDIISLLYYFGYLTIKDIDILTNHINFKIPNRIMKEVYNDFFIEILRENDIKIKKEDDSLRDCLEEIVFDGSITKVSSYVSELLKESDNRIFMKFDEKYITLLYFTVLRQNALVNTYTEYPNKFGYIDLFLEKKKEPAKYNIMIELKYIKKSDYSEKLFLSKKEEAKNQLLSYAEDERIEKDNLKKYAVVFVGTEVKLIEEV